MTTQTTSGAWVERWLSAPRFQTYLDAIEGDRALALDLYDWNTEAAAAIVHDLGHLEIALRNAYDGALSAASDNVHWTDPAAGLFAPLHRAKKFRTSGRQVRKIQVDVNRGRREALDQARRHAGAGAGHDKIVAELMFGFWRFLTTAAHHNSLWRPYLRHAFPAGVSRLDIHSRINRLHVLRNRAAHHEPLLTENLPRHLADLLYGANLLDHEIGQHIAARSKLDRLPPRPAPTQAAFVKPGDAALLRT